MDEEIEDMTGKKSRKYHLYVTILIEIHMEEKSNAD